MNMNKKAYQAPTTEVIEMEVQQVLCCSPGSIIEDTDSAIEDQDVQFRSSHRQWGSMFDPTEE